MDIMQDMSAFELKADSIVANGQEPGERAAVDSARRKTTFRIIPMKADTVGVVYTEPLLINAPMHKPKEAAACKYVAERTGIDKLYGKPLFKTAFWDSLMTGTEARPYRPQGIAGDPLPYRFRRDDYVTSALVVSFFLVIWVIAHSRYYLKQRMKGFFFPRGASEKLTTETDAELRGQLFLVFQTCFVMGVLSFDYVQERMPQVFNAVSPYKVLLSAVGLFVLFYGVKVCLYYFVNTVFFDKQTTARWMDTYLLLVLANGVSLFPVALLVVYFDLNFQLTVVLVLLALSLTKILLLYKSFHIFSDYKPTLFHIILYLCTLEIFPSLILWRTLLYGFNLLAVMD